MDDKQLIAAAVRAVEIWADWLRAWAPRLGYPARSAGFSASGATDFDDLCDAADAELARATDAVVEGLPPSAARALRLRAGLERGARPDAEELERALLAVAEELRKRGLVA